MTQNAGTGGWWCVTSVMDNRSCSLPLLGNVSDNPTRVCLLKVHVWFWKRCLMNNPFFFPGSWWMAPHFLHSSIFWKFDSQHTFNFIISLLWCLPWFLLTSPFFFQAPDESKLVFSHFWMLMLLLGARSWGALACCAALGCPAVSGLALGVCEHTGGWLPGNGLLYVLTSEPETRFRAQRRLVINQIRDHLGLNLQITSWGCVHGWLKEENIFSYLQPSERTRHRG